MSDTKVLLDRHAQRRARDGTYDEFRANTEVRVELGAWSRPVTVKGSRLEITVDHSTTKVRDQNGKLGFEFYTPNGTVGPKWTWQCDQDTYLATLVGGMVCEYDRNGRQIRSYERPDS